MRILASVVVVSCFVALPCSAQTILKSEPLMLAPYEVAFVKDASCPSGKVLKVTGSDPRAAPPQGLRGARR